MRIFSWNVNGLRAVLRKGALQDFLAAERPDVLCLQETKAQPGQAEIDLPEYQEVWNPAVRPGYSGTAIFTKIPPLNVRTDLPTMASCADRYGDVLTEGRLLTIELADFYLVDVYVPNSKPDLTRLDLREQFWDPALLSYLQQLERTKPVVICGDFNAAHTPIDLARPDSNHHNAGFTDQERRGISNLLAAGFVDTFRSLHPEERRYTWWSHWNHARANNVGWRIDYFFISAVLQPRLQAAQIHETILGSDHCPISVELD